MSKADLIKGMNEDLAAELGTIIRYNYQASKINGIENMPVRELLRSEMQDEVGHASFLTDAISDLGGEPITAAKTFEKPGKVRGMIEMNIEMEHKDVSNYVAHSKLAEELGEADIKLRLEEMAADEARHARELERLLR